MKKKKGYLSATTIAQRSFCEKQMVLDKLHGKQETDIQKQRRERGDEEHLRHHLAAKRFGRPNDSRCFIASELYGNTDDRTEKLRQFRDTRLLKTFPGRLFTSIYYDISPGVVSVMRRFPLMKRPIKFIVDLVVKRVDR